MPSENAKAVALDISESIRKGERVNKGQIIKKRGYSVSTSKSPTIVTNTKTYKETIRPLIERLEAERDAIIERLKVTRKKAKYRDLMDGLDKTTKNIELLSGRPTDRNSIDLTDKQLEQLLNRGKKRLS